MGPPKDLRSGLARVPVDDPLLLLPQVDTTPWDHPFLTSRNIERFRRYSEWVWQITAASTAHKSHVNCAFAVNMAQNMYKWAKLGAKYGADATLYLNPQDVSAISRPEWEEFDGEHGDIFDGEGFLRAHHGIPVAVPFVNAPNQGGELLSAYQPTPDQGAIQALRERAPTVLHGPLLGLAGHYPYFEWAQLLARHDVIYIAGTPFPAFASGKPYCVFSVGGDLQYDCGRADDLGRAMRLAFAGARCILASNPHTLGHCRRLGLSNVVYLPYPMDTDIYCPGVGRSREWWKARFGGETFVLTTARIDKDAKGHTTEFVEAILDAARDRPDTRFIFLGWGADLEALTASAAEAALGDRIIILPPVGKRRLIDYYRSCDIVLDHFAYGYYGATALEAAAIGKPVVMKLRAEQYAALYCDDVAPVRQAGTAREVHRELLALIDSPERRRRTGEQLREWVVRTHGERDTVPRLIALLQFAADGWHLPPIGPANPLRQPVSPAEREYHQLCHQRALIP